MDDSVTKDLGWFASQFWSTLVVAMSIYGGGRMAEQIVVAIWPQTSDLVTGKMRTLDPGTPLLFRLWYVTRLAHPFVVGALISLIPELPHPDLVTSRISGALWFGGFAGGANGQIHAIVEALTNQVRKAVDLFVPWVRQKLGLPASATVAPPAPTPATDPTPSSDGTALPSDTGKPSDGGEPPEAA